MLEQIAVRRGPRTSSPGSRAGIARRLVRTSVLTFLVTTTAAALPPLASAQSRASCRFQIHVQLSSALTGHPTSGTFHAPRLGRADCAGTLTNQLVFGTGWLEASGSYSTVTQSVFGPLSRCWIGHSSLAFFGSPPVYLSNRRFVRMSSALTGTSVAGALLFSGSGRAGPIGPASPGNERLTYTGVGAFYPDPGQSCMQTPITSGTLSVQLVVTGPR